MSSTLSARVARTTLSAKVVIIGGGIMGTSIAYQLAKAGVKDVVLLEADELASGSSGKPLGGVRAQFSDPANIELGLRSLAAFRRFNEDFGVDIGMQQVGYLFLIRKPEDVDRYRASIDLQNSLGVDSRLISPERAAELSPYVDPRRIVAAAWSPTDGFARPEAVVNTYAAAAARLGAQINTQSPVEGIDRLDDGHAAVHTKDGRVLITHTVICTAGAWSSSSARWSELISRSNRCADKSPSPRHCSRGHRGYRSPSTSALPPTSTEMTMEPACSSVWLIRHNQ